MHTPRTINAESVFSGQGFGLVEVLTQKLDAHADFGGRLGFGRVDRPYIGVLPVVGIIMIVGGISRVLRNASLSPEAATP